MGSRNRWVRPRLCTGSSAMDGRLDHYPGLRGPPEIVAVKVASGGPSVTALDWVIVAFPVLLAFYGYVQGFIVGALSLAGFAVGAFLGTRLAPLLLTQGDHSPYAPLLGLLGALLAGGVFASGLEGLGARVRSALRIPGLRTVDGLLGAALTACVGLGIAWIFGAVALNASSSRPLRSDLQHSEILRALNEILPPSGPILDALARFDPLPSVR